MNWRMSIIGNGSMINLRKVKSHLKEIWNEIPSNLAFLPFLMWESNIVEAKSLQNVIIMLPFFEQWGTNIKGTDQFTNILNPARIHSWACCWYYCHSHSTIIRCMSYIAFNSPHLITTRTPIPIRQITYLDYSLDISKVPYQKSTSVATVYNIVFLIKKKL